MLIVINTLNSMIYNQTICQVGYDFIPISDPTKTVFGVDRFISDFNNYPNWLNFYESIDKENERIYVDNMVKAFLSYLNDGLKKIANIYVVGLKSETSTQYEKCVIKITIGEAHLQDYWASNILKNIPSIFKYIDNSTDNSDHRRQTTLRKITSHSRVRILGIIC